jgi:hypothetical protein
MSTILKHDLQSFLKQQQQQQKQQQKQKHQQQQQQQHQQQQQQRQLSEENSRDQPNILNVHLARTFNESVVSSFFAKMSKL